MSKLSRVFFCAIVTVLLSSACSSSLYVIKASWEEARILAKREKIDELISSQKTPQELREKLSLVLAAREFSLSIGLSPEQSFTTYTDIGRDTLVWVLSACPKASLKSYKWWFPIVGSVPYKGYFNKADGVLDAKEFQVMGYDYYLRPSPAFSTLGWFNDPLLSTVTSFPTHLLAETVIHEILHNTVWVKGHTGFNETLASFVGARGAIELFSADTLIVDSEKAKIIRDEWHDSIVYGEHLREIYDRIVDIFENSNNENESNSDFAKLVGMRDRIYALAEERWKATQSSLLSNRYKTMPVVVNNAILIAQKIYYDNPGTFECLYQRLDRSLPKFIAEIKVITKQASSYGSDPFDLIHQKIDMLPLQCDFAILDPIYATISQSCPCISNKVVDGQPAL